MSTFPASVSLLDVFDSSSVHFLCGTRNVRYLSSRMDSVFLSFSSHVSFSSAMIFSVSCRGDKQAVSGPVRQHETGFSGIKPTLPAVARPPPLY